MPRHDHGAGRAFRWGVLLTGLAAALGYHAVTLDWVPRADLGILGILRRLTNAPRLTACALTVGFAGRRGPLRGPLDPPMMH